LNYSARVSSPRPADLTIVVPTYNERDRLGELVKALFATAADAGVELELIVVDDNSPDGTGAIADELATTARVRVIHRAGKLGLGSAVVEGFAVGTADVLGVMDADFSHPPSFLPVMLAAFRATGADVLVASRYIPGGSTPTWPFKRRLLSRIGCWLARPLSPIRDATSGFFLIKRDIARGASVKAGGFKICLELIARSQARTLVEMPYRFDDREAGASKMSAREAAGYLVQLRELYAERLLGSRGPARTHRILSVADVGALEPAPTAGHEKRA
jgi:dolichol-phosphate mannosyltransferase